MRLSKIESQEGGGRPGYDEGGEFHDGEGKEVPGHPELEEEVALVGLSNAPLGFRWLAAAEERVVVGVDLS